MESADRLEKMTVEQLLERFAATRPLMPAAGSALALVGATAAALGMFVAQKAAAKAASWDDARDIQSAVKRLDYLKLRFSALMTEDADAFVGVMADPSPGSDASRRLMDISFEMTENGLEIMSLCEFLFPRIHPPTWADTAAVFHMAKACTDGTRLILSENVSECTDPAEHVRLSDRLDSIGRTADESSYRLERWFQKTF